MAVLERLGAVSAPGLSAARGGSLEAQAARVLGIKGPIALGRVKPPIALGRVQPVSPVAKLAASPLALREPAAAPLPVAAPPPVAFGRAPVSVPSSSSEPAYVSPTSGAASPSAIATGNASLAPVEAAAPVAAAPSPETPSSTGYYVGAGLLALAVGLGFYMAVR